MTELFEEEQIDRLRVKHQRMAKSLAVKYNKISDEQYEAEFLRGN